MTDDKTKKLLAEILVKTHEGRLDWRETAKPTVFIAAIAGQFTVQVQKGDFDDGYETLFVLRDLEDRELISISSNDRSARGGLMELYDLARRRALRVDDKVDQLLSVLGKLA